MNILVIGNGFDLAHGLPTRYLDFLNFFRNTDGIKFSSAIERFHSGKDYGENYKGFISSYMTNPTGQKGDARLCLIPIRLRIYNTQLRNKSWIESLPESELSIWPFLL